MARHRTPDVPLSVSRPHTRLTIGSFARAVGLTASAVREYGEAGLLVPADVDERTGYRYYSPDQQQRAIWIRRLRDAGLSRRRIAEILDGDLDSALATLGAWASETEDRQTTTAGIVDDLTLILRARSEDNPLQRTSARFDGAVLAAAIDQVSIASGQKGSTPKGVLIELDRAGSILLSTDRYLLIARTSVAEGVQGRGARVGISPDPRTLSWLRARRRVDLVVDAPTGRDGVATMRAWFQDEAGARIEISREPDLFPSAREVTRGDLPVRTRVVFSRDELLAVVRSADEVTLRGDGGEARLRSATKTATGSSSGADAAIVVSAAMLARIAAAASGPWLTCDIDGPAQALCWRTPSQPDFIGLVMPRRR